jgi:hypothetical protein
VYRRYIGSPTAVYGMVLTAAGSASLFLQATLVPAQACGARLRPRITPARTRRAPRSPSGVMGQHRGGQQGGTRDAGGEQDPPGGGAA